MSTLTDFVAGTKPVIGYPKEITFGPITLEGFMMEDGTFRQSIRSTGKALGILSNSHIQSTTLRLAEQATLKASAGDESQGLTAENQATPTPVIVPVRSPGGLSYTINLPMVVEFWKQTALGGGKYSKMALELLGLSAVHSLERVYQEAFNVQDERNTESRLLEWAIRLDAGKHFPLFGGQFHKHFARVTGVAIGHRYAATCLADLVYHRLPEPIYEALKDLNPTTEKGFREFTHSQLMTDDMRQQMREIVAAVTHELANTPAKKDDMLAYRRCLSRLDKTLPRYRKRGANPGVYPKHFKAYHDSKKSESNDGN